MNHVAKKRAGAGDCICRIVRREGDPPDGSSNGQFAEHAGVSQQPTFAQGPQLSNPYQEVHELPDGYIYRHTVPYRPERGFSHGTFPGPANENGMTAGSPWVGPGINGFPQADPSAAMMPQQPTSFEHSMAIPTPAPAAPASPSQPQASCCTKQGDQPLPQPNSQAQTPSGSVRDPYGDLIMGEGQSDMANDSMAFAFSADAAATYGGYKDPVGDNHTPKPSVPTPPGQMDYSSMPHTTTPLNHFTQEPQLFQGRNGHQCHQCHQVMPQHAASGPIGSTAPCAESNVVTDGISQPSHSCHCGPDCQCLYCTAHPHNVPTTNRVTELQRILDKDLRAFPGSRPQSQYGELPTGDENMMSMMQDSALQPKFNHEMNSASTDGFSTLPPQASYFFTTGYQTLQYSVKPDCNDETGTCMCGDDCACLGCTFHTGHDAIPIPMSEVSFPSLIISAKLNMFAVLSD